MALFARSTSPLDFAKASFRTHLNYIRCIEKLLSASSFSASKIGTPFKENAEITRFQKLYKVTVKSIKKDIELAKEDSEFAVIVAPWFPVKCYYALYYLESIFVHLMDGTTHGFFKGGHAAIRKRMYSLRDTNAITFSSHELDKVYLLAEIETLPPITPGRNTRSDFWQHEQCPGSLMKKLMDYKLITDNKKWDLRKPIDRKEKIEYCGKNRLWLLDFFYWYRIKANYRDLDYIDFENGIAFSEILEYLEIYYKAFNIYRVGLVKQINTLL